MTISYRNATTTDLKGLSEDTNEIFANQDSWSFEDFQYAFDQGVFMIIAEENGQRMGFASYIFVLDEIKLILIWVKKEYRNKGIAKGLFSYVIQSSKKYNMRFVLLNVRVTNESALGLYQKLGFKILTARPEYYKKPLENSYLMEWDLFTNLPEKVLNLKDVEHISKPSQV